MPLIRKGRAATDEFVRLADEDALPAGPVIVSLARFRKDREALLARNIPFGVRLKSDESPEALGTDVERLSVVVLEFPKFRDGRAFSWARMLRTRLRYKGEIRATGDFLYDQLSHMTRVGFDAFEAPAHITQADYDRALAEMRYVYQPSTDGRTTVWQIRRQKPEDRNQK